MEKSRKSENMSESGKEKRKVEEEKKVETR